jgi:hypothetical protein
VPISAFTNRQSFAQTEAVRRALRTNGDAVTVSDLLFLEAWEAAPMADVAATLRAGQIRRANPALAAEIRAELNRKRPLSEAERAALAETV